MMREIIYLWQLPQNLLGLILITFLGTDRIQKGIYHWRLRGSISLGSYILLNTDAGATTLQHEQGHQKQSLYLGPLYLLVIGLPSIIWAGLHRYIPAISRRWSYYEFYTEAWADKLGGVAR